MFEVGYYINDEFRKCLRWIGKYPETNQERIGPKISKISRHRLTD